MGFLSRLFVPLRLCCVQWRSFCRGCSRTKLALSSFSTEIFLFVFHKWDILQGWDAVVSFYLVVGSFSWNIVPGFSGQWSKLLVFLFFVFSGNLFLNFAFYFHSCVLPWLDLQCWHWAILTEELDFLCGFIQMVYLLQQISGKMFGFLFIDKRDFFFSRQQNFGVLQTWTGCFLLLWWLNVCILAILLLFLFVFPVFFELCSCTKACTSK